MCFYNKKNLDCDTVLLSIACRLHISSHTRSPCCFFSFDLPLIFPPKLISLRHHSLAHDNPIGKEPLQSVQLTPFLWINNSLSVPFSSSSYRNQTKHTEISHILNQISPHWSWAMVMPGAQLPLCAGLNALCLPQSRAFEYLIPTWRPLLGEAWHVWTSRRKYVSRIGLWGF